MQFNFRTDENTKKQFELLCEKIGMSSSTALNIYMKKAIREQRIPIELSLNKSREELENDIMRARQGNDVSQSFDNTKDLFTHLNKCAEDLNNANQDNK